jgi:hypothetical protein
MSKFAAKAESHLLLEFSVPPELLGDQIEAVPVSIDYTNWKGERRERHIMPLMVWFGLSKYHQGAQWFMKALDLEDGQRKDFAMKDVHRWG